MKPIEATVLYDHGTHLVVLPKKVPVGRTVHVGEPRNIEARVVNHALDGLTKCEVLPEHLPRRACFAHDWLPESMHGEHGPLVGGEV
jgi:hypothetical protein